MKYFDILKAEDVNEALFVSIDEDGAEPQEGLDE